MNMQTNHKETKTRTELTYKRGLKREQVNEHIIPAIREGKVSASDMADVVTYVRKWEDEGHYDAWAHNRIWERG